jgi:hypothetical protein
MVFLSARPCTVAQRSCRALAHSPLSHALIAGLYVVVFLATLPCSIAPNSCSALVHSPPFSHALIAEFTHRPSRTR